MVSLWCSVLFRPLGMIMVSVEAVGCGCFERMLHVKLLLSKQLHREHSHASDPCTMLDILYNLCTIKLFFFKVWI